MWEIPALAVLMELRSRAVLHDMGKFELQVLYARAMTRLWEKIERLQELPDLRISDFGTRRRHSFLWQDWAVQAMIEGLGQRFTGSSNCLDRDAARHRGDRHQRPRAADGLRRARRRRRRPGARRPTGCWRTGTPTTTATCGSILPDTYGTKGFLERAPDWLAVLDRHPHRLRGSRGRRGDRDRLVGEPRPGPEGEAGDLLGRARRRPHRGALRPLPRTGEAQLRLGDAADQRLPRPGARRRARRRSAWSARRSAPTAGRRSSSRTTRRRRSGRPTRWSATSGCSGSGRRWRSRCWCRAIPPVFPAGWRGRNAAGKRLESGWKAAIRFRRWKSGGQRAAARMASVMARSRPRRG